MAALTSQAATLAGVAPTPVSVSASDTIAAGQFGAIGIRLRVINGGASPDTVTIVDPNLTQQMGSVATNPTVTVTNGTTKEIFIPLAAVNASGVATINHSFTTTVTCEPWKVP